MLTPFGIALRKLRLDKRLRLLDLAQRLNQSSAFVSAVETGRKPIPASYVKLIGAALALSPSEQGDLQRAADQTRSEVHVGQLAGSQRELVAAFARQVDAMPEDLLAAMRRQFFKSAEDDAPFRRRRGLVVPPASAKMLRDLSQAVRSAVVPSETIEFPIIGLLEFGLGSIFPGFYLEVCDYTEMGQDEGRVVAGEDRIILREDVYEGACRGNGRDRFTACHELGHFLLHRKVTMARARGDNQPIYRDAEWQADVFAGALLMSPLHAGLFSCAEDAARRCGVTPAAARVMLAKYHKEGLA